MARRADTPPDATVGYIEIGLVGYHARRRMVDPFGLVTPGVAEAIARRDFLHAYRTHRPDVILHQPGYFPAEYLGILVDEAWFTPRLPCGGDAGRAAHG